jgi:hypothetical protein
LETRKTTAKNSNDGGHKDPTRKNIEKSHTVYTSTKRKKDTQKTRIEIPETQESPRAMDVDEIIEEASWFEQRLMETQEIVEALVTQEP